MRSKTPSHRCTAIKADGTPCNAWAVRGSDPPRCVAHKDWHLDRRDEQSPALRQAQGPEAAISSAAGSANNLPLTQPRQVTGRSQEVVDITAVLNDLYAKQRKLSAYIDAHLGELDTGDYARLLALHGQNASRLGRLLRDQRALTGDAALGMSKAISQALDELAKELGVDL